MPANFRQTSVPGAEEIKNEVNVFSAPKQVTIT